MRAPSSIASRVFSTALATLALATGPSAWAGTYEVLHHFDGRHGASPMGGLAIDPSGTAVYGTTAQGTSLGSGTLYRLSEEGYQSLHYFRGGRADGSGPRAALTVDSKGRIVGTTARGGPADAGTVFRYDPLNGYEMIFAFPGGSGGSQPSAALTEASDGSFFGTTGNGGGLCDCGTVFRLYPDSGVLTTLHTFDGADGATPYSDILQLGNQLYGVTTAGFVGESGSPFSLNSDGSGFATIAPTDGGRNFYGGLTPDGAGNLWGTSCTGGSNDGGTIYRIDAAGQHDVVFSFFRGYRYANCPQAKLLFAADGLLYGTTNDRGRGGTIFRFDPVNLTLAVVHAFELRRNGVWPYWATLAEDSSGRLYGTTLYGGRFGYGVLYRFTP
jgi:uncharacterized repeat protein (TIGR03803 family)